MSFERTIESLEKENKTQDFVIHPIVIKNRELNPIKHVDKALTILQEHGVELTHVKTANSPLVPIMSNLLEFGTDNVVAITRTLAQNENFNRIMNDRISEIVSSDLHLDIAESFNSIREDAQRMINNAHKGKLTIKGKLQDKWMKIRRGSINDRFISVAKSASEVIEKTQHQLDIERAFADGYKSIRMGIKQSQIIACEIRNNARVEADKYQEQLKEIQKNIDSCKDNDNKALMELDRDEALSVYQKADEKYQIAEDIYNNLTSAYSTGDVILTRLIQSTEAKERVQRQTVAFFATNSNVLTALSTALSSTDTLNETTRSLRALKEGINSSLYALADVGTKVQEEALKEGYTSSNDVEPIKKLLASIIEYQEHSHEIIRNAREISTKNAKELSDIVSTSRNKLVKIIQKQALENTKPEEENTNIGTD